MLVDTSSGWRRRLIRGVANYGLQHGLWQLIVEERGINESMHLNPSWQSDGIIARISTLRLYRELILSGKPVVNISGIMLEGVDLPRVTTDYNATALLALQHFKERGFHNLAYCGPGNLSYVDRCSQAFVECAARHNMGCNVFHSRFKKKNWISETERDELQRWLHDLPKPVGMLAWATRRGRDIINICYETGILVPESVAVLAGDDDDLFCELCHPAMSGIVGPAEQIGYEAARILDLQFQGVPAPEEPKLLKPLEVHTRLSTDTLAIKDPVVRRTIHFIRENAHRIIQVSDVADVTDISRRALERRFEATVGFSPAQYIQQTRLQRARKLLRETDMSISDVAAASGYCSAEYMSGIFSRATGRTPLKYRRWVRAT